MVVRTPTSLPPPFSLLSFILPFLLLLLVFVVLFLRVTKLAYALVCVSEREVVNMWGKDRVKKAVREQKKGKKVRRMK